VFLGLRTAIYPVIDLNQAKRWYAQVLDRQPYFDEPYYVGFEVGGFELGLIPDGEASKAGVQAYWGVPDAAVAYARLVALGAHSLEAPHDVGGGIIVGAVLDPFGNRLCVIQNPHFDLGKVR
jgi:predicted enzyme related to lactoylglutathione lyase